MFFIEFWVASRHRDLYIDQIFREPELYQESYEPAEDEKPNNNSDSPIKYLTHTHARLSNGFYWRYADW